MHNDVFVVSGLPRSGTSMMMKMLEAGGISILTDEIRQADADNPKGYYELEKVKQLKKDDSWVGQARGKAIKVISALLKDLPPEHHYKVIFMRRRMEEILASQQKMLVRRGEPTDRVDDEQMAALFEKHLQAIETWLDAQSNFDVFYISFNDVVANPADFAEAVNEFLGGELDVEAMAQVVDPKLYRQRRT